MQTSKKKKKKKKLAGSTNVLRAMQHLEATWDLLDYQRHPSETNVNRF